MADCDLRYAIITGSHWLPEGDDIPACCAKKYAHDAIQYNFCIEMCSLCCKKLILEYECPDPGTRPKDSKSIDDKREFPTTSVTDNGISFSTSAYGTDLPIVFGSDKLTGNVFWASPVRKTLLSATEFYQTIDFAFGLCEGEINGLLRMWLGEKLIIDNSANVDVNGIIQAAADGFIAGSSVDLTDPNGPLRNLAATARQTRITVFTGSEHQLPEGVMVSRDGYDQVPGYRGLAYVLFENFIVADTSIPNIFCEVTSNTANDFPRLYGVQSTTPVLFDVPTGDVVLVDPSYDITHVSSKKTSPATDGITTWNNNDLSRLSEDDIKTTLGGVNIIWKSARLLPLTGFLILPESNGNPGTLRVWNPFGRVITDTFGPGGGIAGHNLVTGMATVGQGSITFTSLDPITGAPIDVFMGFGDTNSSIGFATINDAGKINFVSTLNNALPADSGRSVHYPVNTALYEASPTFFDGAPTLGQHVFMCVHAVNATTQVQMVRCTVQSEKTTPKATLTAPILTTVQTIPTSDLIGTGFAHDTSLILVDPKDNCLVIFTRSASYFDGLIWKWNPFTGAIVWKTQTDNYLTAGQGSNSAYLAGSTYAWIGQSGVGINVLDMKAGTVTQKAALTSSQNLPVNAGGGQFFNGVENTITYVSTAAGKHIVKTYLDRITRQTIDLSTIVRLLLERVGLQKTDMDVVDLSGLSLNGYTIHSRQTLRTSFAELGQAFTYDVIESNGRVKYKTRGGAVVETVDKKYLGEIEDMGWFAAEDQNDISKYRKINLTYRDLGREYKDNTQAIILPRYGSETFDNDAAIDVKVPIVLEAVVAKKLAEILLYSKVTADTSYRFSLPQRFTHLDPGDVIDVGLSDTDTATTVRIRKLTVGADRSVVVEASKEDTDIYNDQVNLFGALGDYDPSIFQTMPSRVDSLIMDIPYLSSDDAAASLNTLYLNTVFLNNRPNASIKNDVTITVDGKTEYTIPKPNNFPTWGYVTAAPSPTGSLFTTDYTRSFTVRLVSTTGVSIASTTLDTALSLDQVNLCYCAGELFQFISATDNLNGTWTLTGLHRGKLGTDNHVNQAVIGDKLVFLGNNVGALDVGSIRLTETPADEPRHVVQFFLHSTNPLQPAPLGFWTARNLAAWAVADAQFKWVSVDAIVSWQRRTRYNGEWVDSGDETLPILELDESYVLYFYTDQSVFKVTNPDSYLRKVTVTDLTTYTYTQAQQIADGFDGTLSSVYVSLYQQGGTDGNRYGTGRTLLLAHR